MTAKYKAAVFDLDGTLADTVESLMTSVNLVMEEFGHSGYGPEDIKVFVGDGAKTLMERAFHAAGDDAHAEEGYLRYREIFKEYKSYKVTLYEGMKETLWKLKSMGIRLAVVTNKPHADAVGVVNRLAGENFFDVICGQSEERPKKPDPAGALYVAEKMQVSCGECIYFGDTNVDMQTGNAAGMFTVGVLWGFRTKEELLENHAQLLIEKPEEIVGLFTGQTTSGT